MMNRISSLKAFALVLAILVCGVSVSAEKPGLSSADTNATASPAQNTPALGTRVQTIEIPGPMRSFLRMAAISQEASNGEVLSLLARNAFLYGYQMGRKTEYLMLADRYVHQARELQTLVESDGVIRVKGCENASKLIQILGYQFEHGCSADGAALMTADPERAFLTVDSGFPLTSLERALQEGSTFVYPFPSSRVPVLFNESDWVQLVARRQRTGETLLDLLLSDINIARLYTGLSRVDPATRRMLYQSPGLRRMLPYAAAFDFYGSRICIESGVVQTPGGASAVSDWQSLVGESPRSPGEFVSHLLAKDQGWLAAYFDALSRLSPEQQAHFVEHGRLRAMYDAFRISGGTVDASSGVFPRNAGLLLFLTRMQWDNKGEPQVPGQLAIWSDVIAHDEKAHHEAHGLNKIHVADGPDRLVEALAGYSNHASNSGPAQIFLTLNSINQVRPAGQSLSEATARQMADHFNQLSAWFSTFIEFPALGDACIGQFIDAVGKVNSISNQSLRSNVLGSFQAEIGIWQILARQKQIPEDKLAASWSSMVQPYAAVTNSTELFETARNVLQSTLAAAGATGNLTQDQMIDILAGPSQTNTSAQQVHDEIARRIRQVLEDQRLVSFDTLFGLYDGLGQMEHGAQIADAMTALAGNLKEFEMPRPIFTEGERATWSPMVYVSRHAELQVRTDLTKVIKTPGNAAQLDAARSRLAPFLRDTLVGLNYAYYEPPGAQVLHSNPLFVRSHDFAATSVQGIEAVWGPPSLVGIGATAGGGAYLIGSLADLPYELASAEEDFLAPAKTQALIWREMVPQLLLNATVPRWWEVDQPEMHAVALYQKAGEELLSAAPKNGDLRQKIVAIFADRISLGHSIEMEKALEQPDTANAYIARMLPSDLFYLESEFRKQNPQQATEWGPAGLELSDLIKKEPAATSTEKLSRDFGVPHPTLTDSNACALLVGEPFPASSGYVSRLFSESWESSNLFWARLADEKGYVPAMLNVLVPELTGKMVANISATSIDDWPALQRALSQTGEEFRQGKFSAPAASQTASNAKTGQQGDLAQ